MKKKLDDALKDDSLMKEIAEDIKNEQLKALWDKFGLLIVLVVALSLTAAVSFETFKAWNAKRDQELSNVYAVAVSMQSQGRLDESLKLLQNLSESNRGIYADIAKLQIANIYFEQGKNAEALEMLEKMLESGGVNEQMREIATIKLASYKLDSQAPSAEIVALLEPLTTSKSNWSNIAHEMLAMLAIRDGNIPQAKKEYEIIVNSPDGQDSLKTRAQDMLTILNDENKK